MAVSFQFSSTESHLPIPFVLALTLLGVLVLQNTEISTKIAYAIISLVYIIILFVFIFIQTPVLKGSRFYFKLFLLLSILFFISSFLNVTVSTTIRLFILLIFTSITIFVIPRVIPLGYFLFAVSRLGAVLTLLGFLPYFGLSIQSGIVDFSLWGARMYWYPELSPITSVFVNPNQLGFFTFVGALAAFYEWQKYKTRIAVFLFVMNTVGMMFTNYRTGWVAFIVAVGVFTLYSLGGRRLVLFVTLSGLSALSVVLMMMFAILPGPTELTEISLNGRRQLWLTGVSGFKDQFWLGYGFGNFPVNLHNSFLRMFVVLGVGGGLVYLYFYLSTIVGSIRKSEEYHMIIVPALLIAFLFIQLFNQLTFIGISLRSTMIALMMGYYICGDMKNI